MTRDEIESRLEEIQTEVEFLNNELKKAKPKAMAKRIIIPMYYADSSLTLHKNRIPGNVTGWEELRSLCIRLYYAQGKYSTSRFTEKEMQICANMANEIIKIWNKYMESIYEDQ